jgi:hypothetical protein
MPEVVCAMGVGMNSDLHVETWRFASIAGGIKVGAWRLESIAGGIEVEAWLFCVN